LNDHLARKPQTVPFIIPDLGHRVRLHNVECVAVRMAPNRAATIDFSIDVVNIRIVCKTLAPAWGPRLRFPLRVKIGEACGEQMISAVA